MLPHYAAVATAFQPPKSPLVVDLQRLNDAERRVLRMLAEGHTAKSIANALDSTPAAVNERLREARRKTGVGSSRELARLLRAQERRDEQIGLGRRSLSGPSLSEPAAEPWRPHTGVIAMIAFFLTAAASAAALMIQQPQAGNAVDPLVGTIPGTENAPALLHARVRAEPRDDAWASAAAKALRQRYSKIAHVTGPNGGVRVICGTTLCEVAGIIDALSRKGQEWDPKDPLNAAMRELQGKALRDDLLRIGLDEQGASFQGNPRMTFLQYYRRTKPQ